MKPEQLTPFLLSIIRHALVAGGTLEASRADEVSGQLAAGIVAAIGIGWSWWNEHKNAVVKAELDSK